MMKHICSIVLFFGVGVSGLRISQQNPTEEINPNTEYDMNHVVLMKTGLTTPPGQPEVWSFFSTTNYRADHIAKMVKSLKAQTHPPTHIVLNAGSNKVAAKAHMERFQDHSASATTQVSTELVSEMGPGTKYPTKEFLAKVPHNAYIFVHDDDKIYPSHEIEVMVKHLKTDPNTAAGAWVRKGFVPGYGQECGKLQVQFPVGYASAGLMFTKRMLLGLDHFYQALIRQEPSCKWVDDIAVGGFIWRSGFHMETVMKDKGKDTPVSHVHALGASHARACDNKKCHSAVVHMKYDFSAQKPSPVQSLSPHGIDMFESAPEPSEEKVVWAKEVTEVDGLENVLVD